MARSAKPKQKGKRPGTRNSYTVSSKALAQRRQNGALMPAETKEDYEYNNRLIEHLFAIQQIAANADRHDLVSLKSCFIAYMQLCQNDGFKVGNLAAYSAMGFTNQEWNVFSKRDDPEIKRFCALVQQTCAIARETNIAENQINPVIGIFWQRNYDGLRNDTEQVQNVQDQDDFTGSSQSYKDKYRNIVEE